MNPVSRLDSDLNLATESCSVKGVEEAADVEDLCWERAVLMRAGTSIAQKAPGFHSGFREVCGNGGKAGWVGSGCKLDFQFP